MQNLEKYTSKLDEEDLALIHDLLISMFNYSFSNENIIALLQNQNIIKEWDGETDTLGCDLLTNDISNHFFKKNWPTYGFTTEYKDAIFKEVEDKRDEIIKTIELQK